MLQVHSQSNKNLNFLTVINFWKMTWFISASLLFHGKNTFMKTYPEFNFPSIFSWWPLIIFSLHGVMTPTDWRQIRYSRLTEGKCDLLFESVDQSESNWGASMSSAHWHAHTCGHMLVGPCLNRRWFAEIVYFTRLFLLPRTVSLPQFIYWCN